MKNYFNKIALIMAGIIISLVAITSYKLLTKESYEECILSHVDKGMDAYATRAIKTACRDKTRKISNAESAIKDTDFTEYELREINGRAGAAYGNSFKGIIYNGSTTHHDISEIEFKIGTIVNGKIEARTYKHVFYPTIKPKSTAEFSFQIIPIDKDAKLKWMISGASGPNYTPHYITSNAFSESVNNKANNEKFLFERSGMYAASSLASILLFYPLFLIAVSKATKTQLPKKSLVFIGFITSMIFTVFARHLLSSYGVESKDIILATPIIASAISATLMIIGTP